MRSISLDLLNVTPDLHVPRPSLRLAAIVVMLMFVAAACSSAADEGDGELVVYERDWPSGITESTTIFEDGRVSMMHGEHLERFTLEEPDLELIRAALKVAVVEGSEGDSPKRTVTLADGTVVSAAPPEPDSAVDLLDRLTDTHSFEASQEPGALDDDAPTAEPSEVGSDHEHEPSTAPDHEHESSPVPDSEHDEG